MDIDLGVASLTSQIAQVLLIVWRGKFGDPVVLTARSWSPIWVMLVKQHTLPGNKQVEAYMEAISDKLAYVPRYPITTKM